MILELADMKEFMQEAGDSKIRIAEIETPLQDEKGKPMLGFLAVLTAKADDHIIKYVETIGTAYTENQKDIQDMTAKRQEHMKGLKKQMADESKAFGIGMWSE